MTVWMIYPLAATGKISASVDWLFHSARVEQIYDNLRQGCNLLLLQQRPFSTQGLDRSYFIPMVPFIFGPY